MNITLAISALTLGLVANLHCLGMCGPLALAIPVKPGLPGGRLGGLMTYHSGRLLTYAVLGGIVGVFGAGLQMAGWQQWGSLVMGGLLVAYGLTQLMAVRWKTKGNALRWYGKLHGSVHGFLQRKNHLALLVLGALNGLLPCGVLYLALGASLAAGTVGGSALFMVLFGLGTWPLLIALPWISHRLSGSVRHKLQRALPVVTLALGVLLVLRGAGLGIPLISPATQGADCCTMQMECPAP